MVRSSRAEFGAVWSEVTLGAIADLLGPGRATAPADSGAFFLLFPNPRPLAGPSTAWHVDHDWLAPRRRCGGLKVHAHFGPTVPRAGGMTVLAGGHHVVDAIVRRLPPFPAGAGPHDPPGGHAGPPLPAGAGHRRRRRPRPPPGPHRAVPRPTNAGTEPRLLLNKDLRPVE